MHSMEILGLMVVFLVGYSMAGAGSAVVRLFEEIVADERKTDLSPANKPIENSNLRSSDLSGVDESHRIKRANFEYRVDDGQGNTHFHKQETVGGSRGRAAERKPGASGGVSGAMSGVYRGGRNGMNRQ